MHASHHSDGSNVVSLHKSHWQASSQVKCRLLNTPLAESANWLAQMEGLCVMFGKWARTETLTIDRIDFVFSGALTDPADNYAY